MKRAERWSRAVAKRVAADFKRRRGIGWPWIGCRDELIDAEVLDQIRIAWAVDPQATFTPDEILAFRTYLVEELAKNGYPL